MMRTRPLGSLSITSGALPEIVEYIAGRISASQKTACMSLNVTKYALARRDPRLARILRGAEVVLADGAPVYWFARRLGYRDVHRVTGIDLAEALLKEAVARGWGIYVLGARRESLDRALAALGGAYPGLRIVGAHDGYFGPDEVDALIARINASGADILLVGLGMPQKEYFVDEHRDRLDVRLFLPVGGAIDVWSGGKKRTPRAVQRIGLEWLVRSAYDWRKAAGVIRHGAAFLFEALLARRGGPGGRKARPSGDEKG